MVGAVVVVLEDGAGVVGWDVIGAGFTVAGLVAVGALSKLGAIVPGVVEGAGVETIGALALAFTPVSMAL